MGSECPVAAFYRSDGTRYHPEHKRALQGLTGEETRVRRNKKSGMHRARKSRSASFSPYPMSNDFLSLNF